MRVGFTGTQDGMTTAQFESFVSVILALKPSEFHHGDCVGADEEALAFVAKYIKKAKRVSHPPTEASKRAFTKNDVVKEPKDYLARDRDIVDETDILIATPKSATNVKRSGTWYTARYAESRMKPRYIIEPGGKIVQNEYRTKG